jgi:CRP/FNR family transcriptional regulator, anaerobic regulatory protein
MSENNVGLPPISCVDCKIGRYAVYGPTRAVSSDLVSGRRRGIVTVGPQRTIFREGETVSQIYTLYSGWAYRYRQLPDGRRLILSFLVPGDIVLIENLYARRFVLPFSVKSLTAVSMCAFSLGDMADITQGSPQQEEELDRALQSYLDTLCRRLTDIGRRSALGRVAQLILEIEARLRARNMSEDGQFHFPVRQEDIADALGLTAVYVNRTLDRLRRQNTISFDRAYMKVLDFDSLRAIAEDE